MPRPTKPVPLCCVCIGYQTFLMPADQGMKLVDLMNSAASCKRNYEDGGYRYHVGEQPEVEYVSVKPSQVDFPSGSKTPVPHALIATCSK